MPLGDAAVGTVNGITTYPLQIASASTDGTFFNAESHICPGSLALHPPRSHWTG